MCGISGFFRAHDRVRHGEWKDHPISSKRPELGMLPSEFLAGALMLSALPGGTDAAGVFTARWEELFTFSSSLKAKLMTLKAPGPGSSLLKLNSWQQIARNAGADKCPYVVCHTRMATGSTPSNNHNNHPFVNGQVVGIHNGVLSNDRRLAKKLDLKLNGECDSEVIFAAIDHFMAKGATVRAAVREVDSLLDGWYVVVFALKSDVTKLYIFKGDGGNLSLAPADKFAACFFATSGFWIKSALVEAKRAADEDNKKYIQLPTADDIRVVPFPDNSFVEIDTLALSAPSDVLELIKPIRGLTDSKTEEEKRGAAEEDRGTTAVQQKTALN